MCLSVCVALQVPAVAPSSAPVLAGLAVLRLGSNLLTFLPDGAFAACPALTELYLQNNSLASLTDQSFSGLSVLEVSLSPWRRHLREREDN